MDKEQKHHHSGSGGFSNGFLLGAIVGGGLVFLVGTKKGKQVLKKLTENGFEGISELADLLGEDDDTVIANEYNQEGDMITSDRAEASQTPKPQKVIKRFFRGIKR